MSKLFAGLLMGVTIATGMVAVSQAIAATATSSTSAGISTSAGMGTLEFAPRAAKTDFTRVIDVALDPALYQAHRQVSQARKGCHYTVGDYPRIRPRNHSKHIAMY